MKTLKISKEEMLKRVSVFKDLKPLPIQLDKNIPQEGKDIVYARELLSVIGLDPSEGKTPINSGAPIVGAGGITMTLAKCPVGQGPGLHNHLATFETFTVLEGEFLIKWNDDGSEELVLKNMIQSLYHLVYVDLLQILGKKKAFYKLLFQEVYMI